MLKAQRGGAGGERTSMDAGRYHPLVIQDVYTQWCAVSSTRCSARGTRHVMGCSCVYVCVVLW